MDEILFEVRGRLGLVTLNRPQAMNALTHGMLLALGRQLDAWAADPAIAVVAIRGAGERAFAAGGDIRTLWEQGREDGTRNFRFFADEYRLNTKIKRYPKPYVAIMDGIVMGGGVGVSIHGSLRLATERTVFAMPETGIGLFPDVGATYFLPRLRGATGMWLALTGSRLKGQECAAAGIAEGIVPSASIARVLDELAADGTLGNDPEDTIPGSRFYWGEGEHRFQPDIDACFQGNSVEEILATLSSAQTEWAAEQRRTILTKSPASTRIAFRQVREGARLGFEDAMRLEYRLARWCMTHPDFYEGVRAVIIDKDNAPKWRPATLAEADDAFVADAFAPLGAEELALEVSASDSSERP